MTAPYLDSSRPFVFHTSPVCLEGQAIPEGRRRIAVAALRRRLPGW